MSAAAPWSVKGIDPKAREVAKDLARRSGMTLGEWLNSMIMEGDDEDGIVPLPRRAHVADTYERRSRSRRLDDAYGLAGDDPVQRLSATVEMMAERLEAAERRSTIAIQGVDQAVAGLVRRLDAQDGRDNGVVRRIDDIAEELREGHRRLRRFEQETGPSTAEGFAKTETAIGALSSRLYDIEERQRIGTHELRQRLDAVEKTAEANRGVEILEHVGRRLDAAQAQTGEALRGLERAFSELDRRMGLSEARAETRGHAPDPAERYEGKLEKLAEAKNCKSGGGWDTHGNNFVCLKDVLLPELDHSFTALLDDLAERGLLDETLIMVNSEMGRKPKIGDPRSGGEKGQGRDHWTPAQSVLFAGGGIRGGQAYGTSDRHAAYPADLPIAPEDIAKTVYHAMGIDDLTAIDKGGRPYNLMEEGRPITELF